jgi:hypothetical protein
MIKHNFLLWGILELNEDADKQGVRTKMVENIEGPQINPLPNFIKHILVHIYYTQTNW